MAKRFSATEIWDEDWFIDMPKDYKLFWFYMLSSCNHAGLFRVNLTVFCKINNVKITSKKALEYFNFEKERIRVIRSDLWFIEDFIAFQYGHKLNHKNNAHVSVLEILNKFNINILSVRGVTEVSNGSGTSLGQVKDGSTSGVGRGQG